MQDIKIMTFNIRVSVDKGANDFDKRKVRIFELLENELPDVIGFQEVNDYMRKGLREGLSGYTLAGCGREKNYHGEGATVAFRTDKFEVIEVKNFWLSNTPAVAGSRYVADQSGCPRITTAVLLKPDDAEPFWFINTHLDHEGERARVLGSTQLMQFISECRYPVVMTGDFNALPDDMCIKQITSDKTLKLWDCTESIKGSFHAYRELSEEEMSKIDYIFTNIPDFGEPVLHDDVPVNGTFMSDHRPMSVVFRI